ncbi:MAG: hypothetical protein GXP00_12180 [Alphaproteobacteria bacterium]|nr:hypothetical protein [Alphaproteobacteria bacterium]
MIEGYEYPSEMPDIFIDDDGIVNVLFGTIMMTSEHVIYSAGVVRKLRPGQKMPILNICEAALNVEKSLSEVGQLDWVSETVSALAIVTDTKIGRILGNIFMRLQKNPYPTKLFNSEAAARKWLMNYCNI